MHYVSLTLLPHLPFYAVEPFSTYLLLRRDSKNYPSARKFAQKSLNLHPTPEAEKLLQLIEEEAASEGSASSSATSSSTSSFKATGAEAHASASSMRSRPTASSAAADADGAGPSSTSKASYTEAQIKLVRRVRNCKVTDYYEILELQKTCEENDIKKAYRKVSSRSRRYASYSSWVSARSTITP